MMELSLLFLLGAFHGINPGMGWLFAVALGMQERRAAAVWRALLPLGLGHALAIAAVLAAAALAGAALPRGATQVVVGILLISLGVRRLVRQRHAGWGGMRVGYAGLTAWSFLMATAHGAGLMVLPIVMRSDGAVEAASVHGAHAHHAAPAAAGVASALAATGVHAAGYLGVTALVALVVYLKVGVGLLRTAWVNLDFIWASALVVTGIAALVM
jgi:hypothetical protein